MGGVAPQSVSWRIRIDSQRMATQDLPLPTVVPPLLRLIGMEPLPTPMQLLPARSLACLSSAANLLRYRGEGEEDSEGRVLLEEAHRAEEVPQFSITSCLILPLRPGDVEVITLPGVLIMDEDVAAEAAMGNDKEMELRLRLLHRFYSS